MVNTKNMLIGALILFCLSLVTVNIAYAAQPPPVITISSPSAGAVDSATSVWLNATTDVNSNCNYKLDSGNYSAMSTTGAKTHSQYLTGLTDGDRTAYVNCTRGGGGSNSEKNVTWTVDTTPPSIYYNPSSISAGIYAQDWILINVTCSDTHKSAVLLNWNNTNQTFATTSGDFYWTNKTSLANANYTFKAFCNDTVGNTNSTAQTTVELNKCYPSMANTSWSSWSDISCSGTQMNQSHFLVQYDQNFCGEISNATFYEYQLVGPDYANTSWSSWYDLGSCQANDTIIQEKTLIQYDTYGCASNITFYDYQEAACDYCTPDMTNTSWSDWANETCSGYQMNQSRFLTQYDQNYCGEVDNTTFYENRLTGPDYANTSWSAWTNISCLSGDVMNQSRSLTQSDTYGCATNETFTEYQSTEYCKFTITTVSTGHSRSSGPTTLSNTTINTTIPAAKKPKTATTPAATLPQAVEPPETTPVAAPVNQEIAPPAEKPAGPAGMTGLFIGAADLLSSNWVWPVAGIGAGLALFVGRRQIMGLINRIRPPKSGSAPKKQP